MIGFSQIECIRIVLVDVRVAYFDVIIFENFNNMLYLVCCTVYPSLLMGVFIELGGITFFKEFPGNFSDIRY